MFEIALIMAKGMVTHPVLTKNALKIKHAVYTKVQDLTVQAITSEEPIRMEDLAKYEWKPIKKNEGWGKKFGACWFKLNGEVPEQYRDKKTVVLMDVHGEGLSYIDDEPVNIISPAVNAYSVPDTLLPPRIGKKVLDVVHDNKVDCLVDCGYNGMNGIFLQRAVFKYAYIATKDEAINKYYYDYLTLTLLLMASGKGPHFTPELRRELTQALTDSYDAFAKGNLAEAEQLLVPYYSKKQDYNCTKYTMIGHAHLDLAWMWPERESKRKAVRTFAQAVHLMEEYPEYIFGASQAQMFQWAKDASPVLFEKIKKFVASGRLDIQGGMWAESDCNMPSGESLIKQFYYGDKFFLENFGKTSTTVWLPDAFGYPWTLPQIIKGVGKDNFATIKLTWNTVNEFPYQNFYWVAPDGSKVLSHISPEKSYCNEASPLAMEKAERNLKQKDVGVALLIYGNSDGGGGPGESHLETAKRIRSLYGTAKAEFGTTTGFFDELKTVENLPEYKDELYLERHQGTLTSQSDNKKYNRLNERELHINEWLSVVDGKTVDLDEDIKHLLFTQFHDVLPGSSINRVHRETQAFLKEMFAKVSKINSDKIAALSTGQAMSAVNPSPFSRDEIVAANGKIYRYTGAGYSAGKLTEADAPNVVAGKNYLENDLVKVTFAADGSISSYLDKSRNKEICLNGLNVITIYRDSPSINDAWDIKSSYVKHSEKLTAVSQKSYLSNGKAVMELVYEYGKSKIKQVISLSDSSMVNVDNFISWHESHKMLRADFCPTAYGGEAECDIQFGHINRSTREDNSIEKAKFEICAHKYISTHDAESAFAIYSGSKYGFRAKNGCISINLLRSPKYPDKECDMCDHTFSYAMDILTNSEETVKRAYNYAYPLIITENEVNIDPIVTTDKDNIIIETIKPAYDGSGIVVRMYERFGKETTANITVNRQYEKLYLSDLLENNLSETAASIAFRPYEIKTLIIK